MNGLVLLKIYDCFSTYKLVLGVSTYKLVLGACLLIIWWWNSYWFQHSTADHFELTTVHVTVVEHAASSGS